MRPVLSEYPKRIDNPMIMHLKVIPTPPDSLPDQFHPLFEGGVRIETLVDCSIIRTLCSGIGIDPLYVDERVQTVFLNHRAVDDMEMAIVKEGSVIALSAALPGTAGATLRKRGRYSAMRGEISYPPERETCLRERSGLITLKLFNMTLKELTPLLLKRGVIVGRAELSRLIEDRNISLPAVDMEKSDRVILKTLST